MYQFEPLVIDIQASWCKVLSLSWKVNRSTLNARQDVIMSSLQFINAVTGEVANLKAYL
jgi:hypothetical protein